MRKLKKYVIPQFKSKGRERAFWATHDSSDYLDWTKAQRALLPDLKPSVRTISLRLQPKVAATRLTAPINMGALDYEDHIGDPGTVFFAVPRPPNTESRYANSSVAEKLEAKSPAGAKTRKALAGKLRHLRKETVRIRGLIEREFEKIGPKE